MWSERRTAAIERDRAMWGTYARTGHLLNLLILVIDTAYVVATWNTGPNRPFLLGLNLAGVMGMVVAIVVVPEAKMAASPRRDLIFGSWMLVGTVLITAAAWADGGLASPLAWLLPMSVMFTAVAHRPAMVCLSGAFAVVGFMVLTVSDGTVSDGTVASGPAATTARLGYLAVLTFAAASGARSRWAHHDEQEERNDELCVLADMDGLTGVLNHRAFHERLATELAGCERLAMSATVMLIDLDHFKAINDRYGHPVGDAVLRSVGAAILGSVRSGDLVGRVGGEEFAVFLGAATTPNAQRLAARVRAAVAEIADPEPITASIGIGKSDGGRMCPSDLLGRADEALYQAKHQGRDRTCLLRAA